MWTLPWAYLTQRWHNKCKCIPVGRAAILNNVIERKGQTMKTLKMAILAAVAFAGALQVQAQTTNLVQNLNVQLFGFSQGGVSNFRGTVTTNVNIVQIGTRQIIQALGTSTGN